MVSVLAVAVVAASGVRVVHAASTLREAREDMIDAAAALRDGELERADDLLARAESGLGEVTETLHTAPDITLLGLVPGLNHNLTVLRRSLHLASVLLHGGRLLIDAAEPLRGDDGKLELALEQAEIDVDLVDDLRREVDSLLVELTVTVRDEVSWMLLPSVKDLADSVAERAREHMSQLDRARRGMTILDELLGVSSPTRTLIAVANTAEMRGAGGMMLNFGVLDGANGKATISEFERVEELRVASGLEPSRAGLPEDFAARWDGFDLTREWRNATLGADFDLMAPALLAMYERSTGVPADNVLQVDTHALAAMLTITGPVQVPELGAVTADNVVDLVLNEAYRLFPGVEERTDVLGEVAEAVFTALVEGEFSSARDLANALVGAVDGRHLVMYSRDPTVQSALSFYEADGSLPSPDDLDALHLTVQNMSGNKLDYYIDTALEVSGERTPGEVGELTVTIRVTNNAPVGETEPQYIFGPYDEDNVAGEYRGVVSLYLPAGSSLVSADGDGFRQAPAQESEASQPVVGYWVDVPAGQTHEAELTLSMAPPPGGTGYSLLLVPSPRIRPTTATVEITTGNDEVSGDVVLDSSWRFTSDGPVSLAGY